MQVLRFIWRITRRLVWETATDNTTGLAAQMAYLLLIALAPGLLFLWHLLGLFGTDPAKLHRMFVILKEFLPPDPKVQDILDSALASVVEDRHWWSKYIISFFLLFWFGLTILVCFNAVVFGETLAGIAEVNLQLKIPLQEWVAALNLPLTAIALIILALGLYLLTPENYLTIRQALPGAILFAVGWLAVTNLFQLYVAKYDRYNPTYHALASIIILLTWMYLTCLLLLLGGKLNAILRRERERDLQNSAPAPQPA